jgi:hypothetical protein
MKAMARLIFIDEIHEIVGTDYANLATAVTYKIVHEVLPLIEIVTNMAEKKITKKMSSVVKNCEITKHLGVDDGSFENKGSRPASKRIKSLKIQRHARGRKRDIVFKMHIKNKSSQKYIFRAYTLSEKVVSSPVKSVMTATR